jgi:electron transfer flavoprotein beta subunit
VAVCWKPVELRSEVDALSGAVSADPWSLGVSPADEAALEWALRWAEQSGTPTSVRVVAAGDHRAATVLRHAIASGADEAVHVRCDPDWPSEWVAHSLAPQLAGALLVWCGDVSSDRGSGSVPAFLAGELGVPQALGAVAVDLGPPLEILRRLDGGRRQRLRAEAGAVVSCEGGTARLRRAPLGRLAMARTASIDAVDGSASAVAPVSVVGSGPFRPRARIVPPPAGVRAADRIRALTGLASTRGSSSVPHAGRNAPVRMEPGEAAATILRTLGEWGELPEELAAALAGPPGSLGPPGQAGQTDGAGPAEENDV